MIACFTIVARNFFSFALTLGDSLSKSNPDVQFSIICADGVDGLNFDDIPYEIIDAREICDHDFNEMSFKYNIVEFCTSIKPQVFKYFLSNKFNKVIYLDPDIYVYSPLSPIIEALDEKEICVTPHLLTCKLEEEPYEEYHHLFEGIFNFGFCAVRSSDATNKFIDWWALRLKKYAYGDYKDGLHTDQKWGDYLPVYFKNQLAILAAPGANVSHWNLGERSITVSDSCYYVNGEPLIFFHFSGFDYHGTGLVKRGWVNTQLAENTPLKLLADNYRDHLRGNHYETYISIVYKFGLYPNGYVVTDLHRRLYRVYNRKVGNPFVDFYSVLDEASLINKAPRAVASCNRKSISGFEEKVRYFHIIFKLILKLIGPSNYTLMIRAFEFFGRYEAHSFLINQKDDK